MDEGTPPCAKSTIGSSCKAVAAKRTAVCHEKTNSSAAGPRPIFGKTGNENA
jgi:hypothetical protein